jgi:hypothetical protein
LQQLSARDVLAGLHESTACSRMTAVSCRHVMCYQLCAQLQFAHSQLLNSCCKADIAGAASKRQAN